MTSSAVAAHSRTISIYPTTLDRVLATTSAALLVVVFVAVARGAPDWPRVGANVWGHLATIVVALVLTPVMLARRRGDRLHRQLGYVWVGAMALTALISFTVRNANSGGFSFIHILSAWTLFQCWLIVTSARAHKVARHRRAIHGMVIGALLIAGFFTFPFDRMLGQWLFAA